MRTGIRSAARLGSRDGYARGWSDGYRLGACQSIASRLPLPELPRRAVKVMFVREDSPGYHLIESGIMAALARSARELVTVTTRDPLVSIAAAERPDLMLVMNGIFILKPDILEQIRAMGVRTAAWFADDPYFPHLTIPLVRHFDHVFTHEAGIVDYYRSLGANAHYLPFAAPLARAFPQRPEFACWSDVCFIGTGFPNRIAFFDRLAPYLKPKKIFIAGALWNQLRSYAELRHAIRLEGVQVDEAVNYYNGAKIVINLHRQPDQTSIPPGVSAMSVNPRTFEINACATLQLTDIRSDLASLYEPGSSIETYATPEECIEKIEYYLRHEEERLRVALGGYEATRRAHAYEHRITVLLETVFGP